MDWIEITEENPLPETTGKASWDALKLCVSNCKCLSTSPLSDEMDLYIEQWVGTKVCRRITRPTEQLLLDLVIF
jgi:translation initiation factor 2 beta subunit (eIF-2beta)/eIF-5